MGGNTPGVLPADRPQDILQPPQISRILRLQQNKQSIRIQPSSPFEIDPFILQPGACTRKGREQGIRQLRDVQSFQPQTLRPDFRDTLLPFAGLCCPLPESILIPLRIIVARLQRASLPEDIKQFLLIHICSPLLSSLRITKHDRA
ncbi:hypothetical protein D3C73_589170 [compost metagenome]